MNPIQTNLALEISRCGADQIAFIVGLLHRRSGLVAQHDEFGPAFECPYKCISKYWCVMLLWVVV